MRLARGHTLNCNPRGIFITATDTGVGKTLIASALVTCLLQRGIDVGVMKPIETGVSRSPQGQSDGVRLQKAAGSHDPIAEVCPYLFRLPIAPLSAAIEEEKRVRVATILRAFSALRQKHEFIVVEGIGGVQVPLTQSLNVEDLIYRMKLPTIVVGRSGLGGVNHAMLTLHALRRRKIRIMALVLNQPLPVNTRTARVQERSTVTLLRRLAGVPVVGPLPYRSSVNRNWNEGLAYLAVTDPMKKLAKLVVATGLKTPLRRR